jgi:hypothetical protein
MRPQGKVFNKKEHQYVAKLKRYYSAVLIFTLRYYFESIGMLFASSSTHFSSNSQKLALVLVLTKFGFTQVLMWHFFEDVLSFKAKKVDSLHLFTLKSDIFLNKLT